MDWVKTKCLHVLVRDELEDVECLLGGDVLDLVGGGLLARARALGNLELLSHVPHLGASTPAGARVDLHLVLVIVVVLAHAHTLAQIVNLLQTHVRVAPACCLCKRRVFLHAKRKEGQERKNIPVYLVCKELPAAMAHTVEHLGDLRDKADLKDRLEQADVAKVARAIGGIAFAFLFKKDVLNTLVPKPPSVDYHFSQVLVRSVVPMRRSFTPCLSGTILRKKRSKKKRKKKNGTTWAWTGRGR